VDGVHQIGTKLVVRSWKNRCNLQIIFWAEKTFENFASFWPEHADIWHGINDGTKYVMSKTMKESDPLAIGWKSTVFLESLAEIEKAQKFRRF